MMQVKNPGGKHIYLVGFMGSGKSTIGPRLAEELGVPFIDLDEAIEKEQETTISDIFRDRGETYFRKLETRHLNSVSTEPSPRVIAVGGGAFTVAENRRIIRRSGYSVWLDVSLADAADRCRSTGRPLAGDRRRFEELFRDRRKHYEKADIRIHVAGRSPEELARRIQQKLRDTNLPAT